MNEIQLYRQLQTAVGELNELVVGLYNGAITVADAVTAAQPIVDALKIDLDNEAGV